MYTLANKLVGRTAALLLAVVALAACHMEAPPYPPAPPAALLDMLLADYRALGLPLPPPDAPLVRVGPMGRMTRAGGQSQWIYYLGFELPSATGEPPVVLVGTERITGYVRRTDVVRVQPAAEAAKGIPDVFGYWWLSSRTSPYETNAALATAIQAKARGWDALAERLLDLASKTQTEQPGSMFFQPKASPPRQALAMLARAHYANQLSKPGSDWRVIASRLEASLAIGAGAPGVDFGPFLRSIYKALAPRRAAPESIEGRIDALCDIPAVASLDAHHGDPAYIYLANLGFAAVPALIEHLDDDRLTRTVQERFNNGLAYHYRLNNIVGALLRGIAGQDAAGKWYRRGVFDPAAVRAWWAEAQAMGEETYLAAHALSDNISVEAPNRTVLFILAHKYPRRLENVYRVALARPNVDTGPIADAIAGSALPDVHKRRLLIVGAERRHLAYRFAALRRLRPLDAEAYARILARALDVLCISPEGPYYLSPEATASQLAAETDDPRVWAALLRAARRSDVGLRMELIGRLEQLGARQRRERLSFLAAFLDDDAVPETRLEPERWFGSVAFGFPNIAVRDLAAMIMAHILDLPTKPKPSWTRAEWEALGVEVKRALATGPTPPAQK